MSLFLVCIVIILSSTLIKANPIINVENIFPQNVTIKRGDVLQCEITKTNIEDIKNYSYVYTVEGENIYSYHLLPISGKCFSFKVRAPSNAFILLSSTSYLVPNGRIEVMLEFEKASYIRQISKPNYLETFRESGIINDREYRGIWIRWLDNELLEVGRESETIPFLYHRFSQNLDVNFMGIRTYTTRGAWIIDGVPKCPGLNETGGQQKTKAESECFILK